MKSLMAQQQQLPNLASYCCNSGHSAVSFSLRGKVQSPQPVRQLRRRPQSARGAATVEATVAEKKQTFASFDDMLMYSSTPVLVDFYATWCGPCQLMGNIINTVAANFPEELKVVKIDIDKYPATATRFRVQALPTLMLFRNGKLIDRIEGVLDQKALSTRLRYYLKGLDAKFGRSQR